MQIISDNFLFVKYCVHLNLSIIFHLFSSVVGNLLVRAQVKSEPSASDTGSGDSGRPSSSGSIHSALPSVSVSSRILPLSTSPSPFNYNSGPLALSLNQHGLPGRDHDRAGSGRSSSNSGMGSPHSTPPPSIGSSQSDTSVCSSLHASQYIKKEPHVTSTVPPHQNYSGQKFNDGLSHSPLLALNGGGRVNGGDNIVSSVTSDKSLNTNKLGCNRNSIDDTIASSSENRLKMSTPDSLTSGTTLAVSSNSLPTSTQKEDEKRINNNTSSYSCGGRLKFFKGKFRNYTY